MWKLFQRKSSKMKITSLDGSSPNTNKSVTLNRPKSQESDYSGSQSSYSLPRETTQLNKSRTLPPPLPSRTPASPATIKSSSTEVTHLKGQSTTSNQQQSNKLRPVSLPPTLTMSAGDDSCAINELLEGRMYLTVFLPSDLVSGSVSCASNPVKVVINVERRTPMMDILVNIATQYKFNASKFRINVDGYDFKASTPIGSLDVNQISIVPKRTKGDFRSSLIEPQTMSSTKTNCSSSAGPTKRSSSLSTSPTTNTAPASYENYGHYYNSHHLNHQLNSSNHPTSSSTHHPQSLPYITNVPFKTTFRLQVNLPRNQLMVLRVEPESTIAQIKAKICKEKELDPDKYQLTGKGERELKLLDPIKSLADYGLNEVTLMSNKSLTQIQIEHSTPNLSVPTTSNDINVAESEDSGGASTPSTNTNGRGRNGPSVFYQSNHDQQRDVSHGVSTNPSKSSKQAIKKRLAPLPPSKSQKIPEESVSSAERSKVVKQCPADFKDKQVSEMPVENNSPIVDAVDGNNGHLRQDSGSDSSGYHESVASSSGSPGLSSSRVANSEACLKNKLITGEPNNYSTSIPMSDKEGGKQQQNQRGVTKKRKAPLPPNWKDSILTGVESGGKSEESIDCMSDISVPLSSSSTSSSASSSESRQSATSDYRTVTERNSSLQRLPGDRSSFTLISRSDDMDDIGTLKGSDKSIPIPSPDSGTDSHGPLDEEKGSDGIISAPGSAVMGDSAIGDTIIEEAEAELREQQKYHEQKIKTNLSIVDREEKSISKLDSNSTYNDVEESVDSTKLQKNDQFLDNTSAKISTKSSNINEKINNDFQTFFSPSKNSNSSTDSEYFEITENSSNSSKSGDDQYSSLITTGNCAMNIKAPLLGDEKNPSTVINNKSNHRHKDNATNVRKDKSLSFRSNNTSFDDKTSEILTDMSEDSEPSTSPSKENKLCQRSTSIETSEELLSEEAQTVDTAPTLPMLIPPTVTQITTFPSSPLSSSSLVTDSKVNLKSPLVETVADETDIETSNQTNNKKKFNQQQSILSSSSFVSQSSTESTIVIQDDDAELINNEKHSQGIILSSPSIEPEVKSSEDAKQCKEKQSDNKTEFEQKDKPLTFEKRIINQDDSSLKSPSISSTIEARLQSMVTKERPKECKENLTIGEKNSQNLSNETVFSMSNLSETNETDIDDKTSKIQSSLKENVDNKKQEESSSEISNEVVRDLCRPRVRLTNFKIGSYKQPDNLNIFDTEPGKKDNQVKDERIKSLNIEAIKPIIVTASLKNGSPNFKSECYEDAKAVTINSEMNKISNSSDKNGRNRSNTSSKIAMFTPQPFKLNRMASWSGNDSKNFRQAYVSTSATIEDKETIAEKAEKIEKVLEMKRPIDKPVDRAASISTSSPNHRPTGGHRCVSQIEINGDSAKVSIRNTVSTNKGEAINDEESPIQVITFLKSSDTAPIVNTKKSTERKEKPLESQSIKVASTVMSNSNNIKNSQPIKQPTKSVTPSVIRSKPVAPPIPSDVSNHTPRVPQPILPSHKHQTIPPPPPPPPPMSGLNNELKNEFLKKQQLIIQRSISIDSESKGKQLVKNVPKFKKTISSEPGSTPNVHDALLNEIRACGGRQALKKISVHR